MLYLRFSQWLTMESTIFWDMMPCGLVQVHHVPKELQPEYMVSGPNTCHSLQMRSLMKNHRATSRVYSNFPRQFHPFGNFIWFQGHEVCHLNSQGFNCEFIPEGLIIHVCVCTSVSCRCQRAAYWTLLSWFIFAFILCLWNSPNFC